MQLGFIIAYLASGLWCQLDLANNCLTILLWTRSLPRQRTVALHTQWRIVLKGGWKTREGERKGRRTRKRKKRARKRRGLVVLGSGGENPEVLFRDADQASRTRIRKNALRTGPRQAVE
ncbi:hypothetical protein TNCV_4090481 [Trichonephila clavipes]|uniref:Secreted protein n=1 Tax=Trichonephila clavipes TaxID=2585209 RepID=A0A8X6S752_TRICX|nr:hypothetical protein TNCV_4090481 [Trichonephila clavipes]